MIASIIVAMLPQVTLVINGGEVLAEVAATPAARRQGLSFRKELALSAGMLLVFERPQRVCLWMRNVGFPLDAIFIDAAGVVAGGAPMLPYSVTRHCSPRAVKYALEVPAGWRRQHHVQTGNRVRGLPLP